jgi:transposase
MHILGVDVSKRELVAVCITRSTTIQASWVIPNTKKAIVAFLTKVRAAYPRLRIGSEATGEYHNVLAKACLEKNIPFFLLNPIVTKQFTRATVRKRKTDSSDAHVIAKCLLQGEGELLLPSAFGTVKPILRTAMRLAEIAVALSHMRQRFADHVHEAPAVAEELATLAAATKASVKRLRRYGGQQADRAAVRLLASIPGVGPTLATTLISEIEDVARFPDARRLVAFAGLDPKVRQSGTSLKRNTKLTKRGSPYLRRAAYLAASIAQRHDPDLKAYYLKKRSEGKRYKEATVANARHILHRVYAVWKRGTPYHSTPHA